MSDEVTIDITEIEFLPKFAVRAQIVPDTVAQYREVLDELPAIEVWL